MQETNSQNKEAREQEKLYREIKRNCLLCSTYRNLKPSESTQKQSVLRNLDYLYKYFTDLYNQLRKDDASTESIRAAFDNKRNCLDAISACEGCDRSVDLVNRSFKLLR